MRHLTRLLVLCTLAVACRQPGQPPAPAGETRRPIGFAELYDPGRKVDFNGHPPAGFVWLDDEHYAVAAKGVWQRIEAASGRAEPLGDPGRAQAAILALGGIDEAEAARLAAHDPARLSRDRKSLLVDARKDLWVWRAEKGQLVRLTHTPELSEEEFELSPDGKHVVFVRANDLYVSDIDPPAERRLTSDGSATVLNGKLDWLYQEEVYGRGTFKSWWWSPDSDEIAFLRLDETGVPLWTLVDDVSATPVVETGPYPRAGEKNPEVRLGLASIAAPEVRWVDLGRWSASEPLVVDVAWLDAERVGFQVQDRVQSWLELASASSQELAPRTLLREESRDWVNLHGSPRVLADGSFLWFSERSGWKHLYRHAADGKLLATLTRGEWEARTLHGVDESAGWVYFSGTERSPIGSDVYRVRLDGSGLQRLSQREGTHVPTFSPACKRYVDQWSDLSTPPQVRLHEADGRETRVIDANPVAALEQYRFVRPEHVQVPTRDGFVMEALLLKPADFDPARRYPVFQHTYAGPHAQQVKNVWGGGAGMFGQLLAARGVVVWVCDNRSASGKGHASEASAFRRLGPGELADIEDGLDWLCAQPWVDPARIGISGWSYGGFMTCYALTHSKRFAMGVAGGTVSDWRNYDSIYTERLMRLPRDNAAGYDETSLLKAAGNLHGALLLLHGAMDDNVHPANTRQLANELQKQLKPHEEVYYAGQRHGLTNPILVRDWRARTLRFVERHLLGLRGD